jgi:PAS domain S-box-containing protein
MRATQAGFAAIALENASTPDWFDVIIKEQRDNRVNHRTLTMTLDTGIVGQVVRSREAVVIANNQAASDYYAPPDAVVTYQSSLAVPLIKGGRVIGVLDIESTKPNFFTAEHVNFIKSLAGHAAVSLENANLVKKLNTNNERMRAILNSTRDGIILLDDDGRILDANIAAQKMLNLPLRDNLESKLADVVRAQTIDHPLFHDLTNGYISNPQSIHEGEYVLPADENQHTATVKAFVIPVNAGKTNSGHMLLLRDVSEEKELQKFRETSQSMVIHDLLGPITSIISNLYWTIQLVQHPGTKPIQETLLPSLSSSVKSAQQLMGLVETLRDIPMIRQMELQPKPILLELIAMNAHELLMGFMRDANITVDYDIPAGLKVNVDSDLVQRVFVNLLHNAAKFTPVDGHIRIIADTQTNQPDYIRVRVCDSGIGIPSEHRERIFGQFVQIENQRPRAGGKGTGLGLNFCKLVVEAHGGTIWVEEENPLSGACFAFTLPTKRPKKQTSKSAK